MINILITCAGRRVELVQEFLRARNEVENLGKIVCVDGSQLAPALSIADQSYVVPKISDPHYLDELLKICSKEKIDLLIPTIDTELEILSCNTSLFEEVGTKVLISDPDVIRISSNKMRTYDFFVRAGVRTPKSYDSSLQEKIEFPCFIKPINGSSSQNAFKVNNQKELEFFKYYIGDYIVQELIEGDEYTVDVFCDFSGDSLLITPRIRLVTRGGEVLISKIANEENLIQQIKQLIAFLKPVGPITIQAIKNVQNHEFYFIEINARYGGGAPLSIKAGADSPKILYLLLKGEKLISHPQATSGMIFSRFDQSVVVR